MLSPEGSIGVVFVDVTDVRRYYGWKWPDSPLPKTARVAGLVALPALLYCKSPPQQGSSGRHVISFLLDVELTRPAAMLGGKLVYEYAVGVQRQGSGKAVKEGKQE